MCVKCGCGKKAGEPGYGKGKKSTAKAAKPMVKKKK